MGNPCSEDEHSVILGLINGKPLLSSVEKSSTTFGVSFMAGTEVPFRSRKDFKSRKEEVAAIRVKFPTKVPVIVERYHKEVQLPILDKTKFLVPQEISMSQFITIIRNRLQLNSQSALYLLVSNHNLASLSRPLSQIYRDYRDDDGFLYVTYASQEVFG